MGRKARIGRVVSDRMDKTVVVLVETTRRHPIYKKTIRYRARFKAHDEDNASKVGDMVRIEETRPLSRDKRWRVTQILERRAVAEVEPEVEPEETG